VPLAFFVAGLSGCQLGKYVDSAHYFEQFAQSGDDNAWNRSAGAFWASRSFLRAQKPDLASEWLKIAAQYDRTFYGLIAQRSLGVDPDFDWRTPQAGWGASGLLKANGTVSEAIRHLKEGRRATADRIIATSSKLPGESAFQRALLAFAVKEKLPRTAMRMSSLVRDRGHDSASYPISPWIPTDGYQVDQALIHAIVRQESKFNPAATSRRGATGLMQLMPQTARYVAARGTAKSEAVTQALTNPERNLAIGQDYVRMLLNAEQVEGDLFLFTIAYNAGPGNLARWKREFADIADPLMFIESIPVSETRAYVERVMADYWIYSARLGQKMTSLDAIAAGDRALYVEQDIRPIWQVASR